MAKIVKYTAIISSILCVLFWLMNNILSGDIGRTLAITFTTISYHFCMRLFVGFAYDRVMNNKADYSRAWFQVSDTENRIYRFLKVKKWKRKMPTYDPEVFSPEKHTWDEIAQAMCQSELVHETNVVLSFVPVIWIIWWGSLWVFIITSICAALFDMIFVIMQRYNRPRILRLAKTDRFT